MGPTPWWERLKLFIVCFFSGHSWRPDQFGDEEFWQCQRCWKMTKSKEVQDGV